MRGKRPHGLGSLGDALTTEAKEKLTRLKEDLQKQAKPANKPANPSSLPKKIGKPLHRWKPKQKMLGAKASIHGSSTAAITKRQKAFKAIRQSDYSPEPDSFSFWVLPPEASVRQTPPSTATEAEIVSFSETVAADTDETGPSNGAPLIGIIGLDFGTSSTKVIIRFPYERDSPAFAIPAPAHCRSEGNAYLWQTVVWIRPNGDMIAWPEPGAQLLYSLKQGLMNDRAWTTIDTDFDITVRRVDAVTGFLNYVIRFARGWLRRERAQFFVNRPTTWFLNVGLPVENYDDQSLVNAYRKSAVAALEAASRNVSANLQIIQGILDEEKIRICESAEEALTFGVTVIPETVAEAAGFMMSNRSAEGIYAMIDVGAMTLDICAFRFWRPDRSDKSHSLYAASVRPLGVEAMYWYLDQGKTLEGFAEQCDRSLWGLLWHTKNDRAPNAECWEPSNYLPVFLVGGGAGNKVHRDRVAALHDWLRKHVQNQGIRFVELPLPPGTDLSASDFSRLAVAWGLSYEPNEIGKFKLPSQIRDLPPPDQADFSGNYIGKENV